MAAETKPFWRSYCAGLFDGDGYVSCRNTKEGGLRLEVGIQMTNPSAIKKISKSYGGSVKKYKRSHRNHNWKDIYNWTIVGRMAEKFLNDIKKFSLIKKEKIDKCLELYSLVLTKSEVASRRWKKIKRNGSKISYFGSESVLTKEEKFERNRLLKEITDIQRSSRGVNYYE